MIFRDVMNGPSKFSSARKIRLLLVYCYLNFGGRSFARARIFFQCLHAWFLVKVVFCKVLVARKTNFYQSSCSQRKTLFPHVHSQMLAKTI